MELSYVPMSNKRLHILLFHHLQRLDDDEPGAEDGSAHSPCLRDLDLKGALGRNST